MIKTIYKLPTSQVYVNGTLSEIFRLERGTRQGCPLSPSLFALAIEPLAQKIRQTEEVSGISIDKQKYKLSLFADDLLLYLTNIKTSLPKVMKIIDEFSKISGYKMNIEKTELMQINKGACIPEDLKNLQWKKKLKYLGCIISPEKTQLYKDNFISLINELKISIKKWSDLPINIIGRINLF